MILHKKSLEKLREYINETPTYRKGWEIVQFFNALGVRNTRREPFPSRWIYTDDILSRINGEPELDKCIKTLFAPINFVGKIQELDKMIADFNQYLLFDGWMVVRENTEINITKSGKVDIGNSTDKKEDDFLNQEFDDVPLDRLGLDTRLLEVLKKRLQEIKVTPFKNAPLSIIFLCGSALEGILFGLSVKFPREFNQAGAAPKDKEGKIKQYHEWSLNDYINVACQLGFLQEDVKRFSIALRDFRNYIHPYQQAMSGFDPDEHTAKICSQVLRAAIFQVSKKM